MPWATPAATSVREISSPIGYATISAISSTSEGDISAELWRVHVQPVRGSTRIADVDLNAVEWWIATMRRKSGATTVIRAYGVLAGVLDDAVKARRLAVNAARGVENLPHKTSKRQVYLTAEDVGRLAAESGQHRALVLTLAYCAVRWGEAVALRVRDVQLLRRRLSVHDNAVQLGVDHTEGLTKSRRERSVPVPAFVLEELAGQCEGRDLTLWCSVTATTTCPDRSPMADGSPAQSSVPRCRRPPLTTSGTPARRWQSAQVSTCCVVTDAGAYVSEGHPGHLRGLIRHRSRCGRFSS
jgi:integrase